MNIRTMTRRQILDAMGSEATDAEADAMLRLLASSRYEDTRDIDDEDWRTMMDQAIAEACE